MKKICTLFCFAIVLMTVQRAKSEGLRVVHSSQGQSTALEVRGDYWYQGVGDSLLVLPNNGGDKITSIMLTSHSGASTCSDLLVHDTDLYVLLDGREVLTFTIEDGSEPKLLKRQSALSLGIIPRDLLMVGDWPVVIGEGGAVRLIDGAQLVDGVGRVTGLVMSIDRGLAYAMGENLFAADTDERLGAATTLVELNDNSDADIGTLVYTRNHEGKTEVGMMDGGMRDIAAPDATVLLEGTFRNMLVRRSRIIVTTDAAVYIVGIAPDELHVLQTLQLEGVLDVDVIASNYLAVCGEFGRGIYRIETDRGGDGRQLIRAVYSTGKMAPGEFDLQGVLIPTGRSSVYYGFDHTLTPFESPAQIVSAPKSAVILGQGAAIDPKIGAVIVSDATGWKTVLELPSPAKTVVPIAGNFWIGTEDGVYVFGSDGRGKCVELASLILSGPIVQLIPLLEGGAAFVSEAGMVGILALAQDQVMPVPEPELVQ